MHLTVKTAKVKLGLKSIEMTKKIPVILYLLGQIFIFPNYIESIKMDIPNAIDAIVSYRNIWSENQECSIELNSIKTGIDNNEEWVTKCEFDLSMKMC